MTNTASTASLDRLAHCLLGAQQTAAIYPPAHPRVSAAARELYLAATDALAEQELIRMACTGDSLVFGDTSIPIAGDMRQGIADVFERWRIQRLMIGRGLRRWEVQSMITALAERPRGDTPADALEQRLRADGVEHVAVGQFARPDEGPAEVDEQADFDPWDSYGEALALAQSITAAVNRSPDEIDDREVASLAGNVVEIVERHPDMITMMHALQQHDTYSYTHSLNVALLSSQIARSMGVPAIVLEKVAVAALLHDIGKARTPDEVLNKPGKLTPEEWELMQQHSADGVKMLVASASADDLSAVVAYEHQLAYEHDNPDHGRWPLHFVSEIVCVADVYDALRSKRPYRDALPADVAMQIMEDEAEAKFNLDVFAGFRRLVGYYPPPCLLRLADGRTAVSIRSNAQAVKHPTVLVVRDAAGEEIEPPLELDLAEAGIAVERILASDETDVEALDYLV